MTPSRLRSQRPGPCSPLRGRRGEPGSRGDRPLPAGRPGPPRGPTRYRSRREAPGATRGRDKAQAQGPRIPTSDPAEPSSEPPRPGQRPPPGPETSLPVLTSGRRLGALAPRRGAWAYWSASEQPTEPRQPQPRSPGAGPLPPLQPVFHAQDPAGIKELQLSRGCGRNTHHAGAQGPACRPPPRPQRSRAPRARPPANGERAARRGRDLGEQMEAGRGGAGIGRTGFRGRTRPKSWPDPGLLEDPALCPPAVCSTGRAHLKPRTQAFRTESERQACFTKSETEVQGIGLPAARSHVVPFTQSLCDSANIWKHLWWALGVK